MSGDLTVNDLTTDDKQPPPIGARVQLNRHVYGYLAGAQGGVVRGGPIRKGKVLVLFDGTAIRSPCPPNPSLPRFPASLTK